MKDWDFERMRKFRGNLTLLQSERNLSQRGLSYLCEVDHAKISKLENSEDSNLTLTMLFELAKGLGVHPKVLIDYDFDFDKKRGNC